MNQRICHWAFPVACLLLLILAGCERDRQQSGTSGKQEEGGAVEAVAELKPTEGNEIFGTVSFEPRDEGILVVARIEGLEPGKHGFHVHEKGDCSAPDASSAGGHFNPTGTPHGAPTDPSEKRHVGDLGNVEADADGKVHMEMVDPVITLDGENSIIGKAVIVHARPDDLRTQPTGDAGPRVACGVIEIRR